MDSTIRKASGQLESRGELRELTREEGEAKFALARRTEKEGTGPSSPPIEITLPLGPQGLSICVTQFDQPHYRKLVEARGRTIRTVVGKLKATVGLSTAVDAGCGVGFFSQTLADLGLAVCGFDGRSANVAEARRRFPEIPFESGDVQDARIRALGQFDLVLCFGLLYHLENPLGAIRNLRDLTGKCLLLESMCVPGEEIRLEPREEPRVEDQGLTNTACYPSENGLVKMLYRAGFTVVYRIMPLPDHDDFRETPKHARRRTVLLASTAPIDAAGLRLMPEPKETGDPWSKGTEERARLGRRLWSFAKSPTRAKYVRLALRMRRRFEKMPIPLRLPFGAWWLAGSSALDEKLMYGSFEAAEMRFARNYLERGMTVLDIGAHHGLYTLLASKKTGSAGRVLAFEPSARERQRLEKHLRVNRCKNTSVLPYALGSERGEASFYLAGGPHDFCNSLRLPDVPDAVEETHVEVRRLDEVLDELVMPRIDFVKLDVEGGELDVLAGAKRLLERRPRPVLLVEVEDRRTGPWGYRAKEILERLVKKGFCWYWADGDGTLAPLNVGAESFEGTYVAVPAECEGEMQRFRKRGIPD
jgi:FkbM family methyltransferase